MEEDLEREIEEIVGGMKCPKDFRCVKSGLQNLCRARDMGIEAVLECLEENPEDCKFSFRFGGAYFCECPLRVYILKKLKK